MPPKKTPVKKPKKKPRQKQKQKQYQQQTVIIHNHPKKTKPKRTTNVSRHATYSPAITNVVAYPPQNHSYLREQIKQDVEGIISENDRQNALVNNLTKDLEMNQARLAFLDTKSVDNIPSSTVRRELIPSTPEKGPDQTPEVPRIERLINQFKNIRENETTYRSIKLSPIQEIAEYLNVSKKHGNNRLKTKQQLIDEINEKL